MVPSASLKITKNRASYPTSELKKICSSCYSAKYSQEQDPLHHAQRQHTDIVSYNFCIIQFLYYICFKRNRMNLQVGKPVTGDELIGREKEIRTIKDLLKAGQSVVLIAPRRFGKTSVLFEVMQELKKEHWFTCYVDLFSVPTLFSLAERITEGVLSNTRLSRLF